MKIRNYRDWQKTAFKKIDEIIDSDENQIIPVNACVGSGKTAVCSYAFAQWIRSANKQNKKTYSIFVSPRLKLNDQQKLAISSNLSYWGLEEKKDFDIIMVDCRNKDYNFDYLPMSKHIIFIICSASLWGNSEQKDKGESKNDEIRFGKWIKYLNRLQKNDKREGGILFLDESHNYQKKVKKIERLRKFFKILMPASGTPPKFQKEYSENEWKKNVCACSFKEAVEKEYVCKPNLYCIFGTPSLNKETHQISDYPNAILAVLNKEKELSEEGENKFPIRILANCSKIDIINSILEVDFIKDKIGKNFHIISIHSDKDYLDENNMKKTLTSRKDFEEISSAEAYELISSLDNENPFNDNLPIVVFQVAMIGEGINVQSFNATIVVSDEQVTSMQQIGRVVRNWDYNGHNKIREGHSNVYVFTENSENLAELLSNLLEYGLTENCFNWKDEIKLPKGWKTEEIKELHKFQWNPLAKLDIQKLLDETKIADEENNLKNLFNDQKEKNSLVNTIGGEDEYKEYFELLQQFKNGVKKNSSNSSSEKKEKDGEEGDGKKRKDKQKQNTLDSEGTTKSTKSTSNSSWEILLTILNHIKTIFSKQPIWEDFDEKEKGGIPLETLLMKIVGRDNDKSDKFVQYTAKILRHRKNFIEACKNLSEANFSS